MKNWILPACSVGMFIFTGYHLISMNRALAVTSPPIPPAEAGVGLWVAGAGVVEARTQNISIGSQLPGVVTSVLVKVGDRVKESDILFRLDDREYLAEKTVAEAQADAARKQLARLQNLPRPEEIPIKAARVRQAKAAMEDKQDNWNRADQLFRNRTVSREVWFNAKQLYEAALADYEASVADEKLLLAGTWKPDLDIAQATVVQAEAQVNRVLSDLDRLLIKAPVAGQILQVNVRPGEFVGAPPSQALIVMGDTSTLHVRVDIDEQDIPRFQRSLAGTDKSAEAVVRGSAEKKFQLMFVRVDPYVIPKKSLTGDSAERVDTRVLQVIYRVVDTAADLYVGQQMDIFIPISNEPIL